ncbi:MAG: ABC transporter permease [Candidatus Binatales bacterium]
MLALLPLAARNLWSRNRRRTFLTTLTVAAATVVFCAVMVVPYVTARIVHMSDQSPRLVITNRASMAYGLPEHYYDKIVALPDVVAVNRMLWFGGVYKDPKDQFPTMALDADSLDVMWPEYGLNNSLMAAFESSKNAALVGIATMNHYGWRVGQNVALRSQVYQLTLTFRIAGVFDQGPDLTPMMLRRDYLEEALHNTGRVDIMWVRCSSPETTTRVAAAIDEMFRNSGAETRSDTEKAFMSQMMNQYKPLMMVVEGIALISVIALGLGVLNATSMSLRERRSELAVLRSLGFAGDQILASLALEAVLVAVGGGILGTLLARAALGWARGSVPALGPLLSFGLPRPVMAEGIGASLAIGLAAALAPALAALRSSVVDALRAVA